MTESKGIKSKIIPKVASGLCGGMSHTDGICGAISGAVLTIDLIDENVKSNDRREDITAKVQKLTKDFKNEFSSTQCYKLTGCDLSTEDGQMKYDIDEVYEKCDKFVEFATDKTLEIFEDK